MENKAADDAAAPAQTPAAADEKPAAESPVESKAAATTEEAVAAVVAPKEEPETKPTGEPEVKTEEPKPEEVKVPEPVPEPVVEEKKEEPVAAEPVKEPEAVVPATTEEKVEEKPVTPVEEKPATPTPIAEESKVVEEPAAKPESEPESVPAPAPEPEPEVVEVSAPVPEQEQKDEPKEVCEVVPPLPVSLPPSQVSVFAESTMASETNPPQKPSESSEIPVHIPQLNSEASPVPKESSTAESIPALSLENTPLSPPPALTKETISVEETISKTIQNVEIPIDVAVVPASVDVTKKFECASPLPVKLDDKITSSSINLEPEIVESLKKEITKEIVEETSSVSVKSDPSEVSPSQVTSDLPKISLADVPLPPVEAKDSVTPPPTPVELLPPATAAASADEKLVDSLEQIDVKTDDIALPAPPAEERLTDSLEKIAPPEEQLIDSLEKADDSVPLVVKEKAPEDQPALVTEIISEPLKVEKTESSPATVDAEAEVETPQVINDSIEAETKTEISKLLDDLPSPPSSISVSEDSLPPPPATLMSSLESQPYDSLEASIPLPSSTEIENSTKEVTCDKTCASNQALSESPQTATAAAELAASLTLSENLETSRASKVEQSLESTLVPTDTIIPDIPSDALVDANELLPTDTIAPSESTVVITPLPSDAASPIPKCETSPLQEAVINPDEIVSVANVSELTAKPSLTNLEPGNETGKPDPETKADPSKPSSLRVIKVADLTLDDSSDVNLNSSGQSESLPKLSTESPIPETNAPETSLLCPEAVTPENNTADLPQLEPTSLPEALPEPYLSASLSGTSNQILEVGGGEKIAEISATESVQDAEPIAAPASEPVAPVEPAPSAEVESVLTQETPTIEIPSQDTSLAVADQ